MSTFKQYLKNQELSKTTREMYHYHTLDFITFLEKDNTEIEDCTPKEIMLYLNYLQKRGISNDTKKVRLYSLQHFFKYQIAHNRRTDNPAEKIKIRGTQQQKLYPILSQEELKQLHHYYHVPTDEDSKSHHNWFRSYQLSRLRNKVIVSLLIHQGITTAEVSRIQLHDLNLRKGEIDIRGGRILQDRTLSLKSHQIIDIMEYQYQTRNQLLSYQKTETKQLFLSTPSSGQQYATGNGKLQIWKGLKRELKKQHPKLINFQQIRTSVITHWLKQYNLRQVQYRAGHKNLYSTEMYLLNNVDDLQADIESFHPVG